ncbi:AmmeMemoRadiSam system radical SAM enzyme [Patescibacteria group bacterium]
MKDANFYIKKDSKIQCQLCNHFCFIAEEDAGICKARKNHQGKLYSLVYGYPIAINVDPIEKKPLYHFLPDSITYSIGTLGCNLSCANCQNWDISQVNKIEDRLNNLPFLSPEKIVEESKFNGCRSIAYTYNEPTIFSEYAIDIMKLAQKENIKNVWVSNGYMSDLCLDAIIPYLDAINVDLKSVDQNFYKSNCAAKLEPVLRNLKRIKQEQVHLEVTTLIIPSLNNNAIMYKDVAEFIATELSSDTPWHISRFSPEISWKLKDFEATSDEMIYEAYDIGKQSGLKYVYVGNIPGDQKENTYCPKCGELSIRRLGYHIERMDNNGRCQSCDASLEIVE